MAPEVLTENMRRNLAFLVGGMPPYTLSGTEAQVFGVLTLCRVLYTLRTGAVASKEAAAAWALGHVDARWHPLIERVLRRYQPGDLGGRDWLLTRQVRAFAAYVSATARWTSGARPDRGNPAGKVRSSHTGVGRVPSVRKPGHDLRFAGAVPSEPLPGAWDSTRVG
jgi:hypothetical protein